MKNEQMKTNNIKKIAFEELFDLSLKERIRRFLESGRPAATMTKGLLLVAGLGGALAVGIMAPNLFKILNIDDSRRKKRLSREGFYSLKRSFYRLKEQKLIELAPANGSLKWRLTEAGRNAIEKILKRDQKIKRPRYWDRKWRLVLFDVPSIQKKAREAFRRELQAMGCYQLQKSVWAYPFSCSREVFETASLFEIEHCVEICTVEDFSNSKALDFFRPLIEDYL